MNVIKRFGHGMPKIRLICLRPKIPIVSLALLIPIMCLCAVQQGSAQADPAAQASSNIQPLNIGDPIPDELWDLPLQVVNHPQGKETITLSEYRDKLIILDFWATWCVPCIKSLHKLDTLQKEFAENLIVVPIAPEEAEKILPFIEKQGWDLLSATNYKELKEYFPHRAVPYQVWIKSNKLIATTNESQATHTNIVELIEKGNAENLLIRKDNLTYNSKKPLLFDGNGGNLSDLMYSSVITGYLEGIFGGGGVQTDSIGRRRLRIMNADIGQLYRTAASRYNHAILFPSRMITDDTVKQLIPDGKPYYQPELRPYFYSYELITPVINDSVLSTYAIEDLNRFFQPIRGIRGHLAERNVSCWVFSLENDQLKAASGSADRESETRYLEDKIVFINEPTEVIFSILQNLFFTIETPIINEMANNKISLEIPYDKDVLTFDEVKDAMVRQGINIKKETRQIEVMIIEKSN